VTGPLVLCVGGVAQNGPGLHADREAIEAAGARFAGSVTANTVQDAHGLVELGARRPEAWLFDALAAVSIENPACLKSGLLPGPEHVNEMRSLLTQLRFDAPGLPWVLDPVLSSSKGDEFLGEAGQRAMLELLDLGPILCPNLEEAALLAGVPVEGLIEKPDQRIHAAKIFLNRGAAAVVLKGGHGKEDPLLDLLVAQGEEPIWVAHARVKGSMRGSGCRHAAFLSALVARGHSLEEALSGAGAWVAGELVKRSGDDGLPPILPAL
jgi:hydroxymethylpyrimidine/phosphomethylpyrimidine kinase